MSAAENTKHEKLIEAVKLRLGDAVLEVDRSFGDLVFVVNRSVLHDALAFLRNDNGFDLLLDIAGVDCLELEDYNERFEIEYMLYSVANDHRARIRAAVPETDLNLPTASDLWQSANWAEREAYEMFGFNFVGHPCLKRLLTHHGFEGHPLRKDYPTMGGQWCSTTSPMMEQLEEEQGGVPE